MNESKHISQSDLLKFHRGHLDSQDVIRILEHIKNCDYCNEQFTDSIMTDYIISAPLDMKSNVLNAIKRPDIQISKKVNATSKRLQLLLYSLKVGTATIMALVILMLITQNSIYQKETVVTDAPHSPSVTVTIKENMNFISDRITDFTNNILKSEEEIYDKKEK